MTDTERLELRARDAVSRCLIRRLMVPNVYFEAAWPSAGHRADLLAIDRAGAGDVHVVEIKFRAEDALAATSALLQVPAQFRWVAFFKETLDPRSEADLLSKRPLYPSSGMGRIGVIEVVRMAGDDLGANVVVNAERFAGSNRSEVAKFVKTVEPDVDFE